MKKNPISINSITTPTWERGENLTPHPLKKYRILSIEYQGIISTQIYAEIILKSYLKIKIVHPERFVFTYMCTSYLHTRYEELELCHFELRWYRKLWKKIWVMFNKNITTNYWLIKKNIYKYDKIIMNVKKKYVDCLGSNTPTLQPYQA